MSNGSATKARVSLVKCDSYDPAKVEAAVHEALTLIGGIGRFVKPGQKVLIKPNALMGVSPEAAVTTHPSIISAVIKEVISVGGIALAGDSPGNAYANVEKSLIASGIKPAVEAAGGQLVYFQQSGVEKINGIPIAKAALAADVITNLAKLKTHGLTLYTGAVKNMFGTVPGFHKSYFHINHPDPADFAEAIVDVFQITKPALNIIDAVIGMEGRGPSEGKPRKLGVIIASADAVAADAVGAYLIGYESLEIKTTAAAHRRKLGEGNLEKIEVVGPALNEIRQADWRHVSNLSGLISRLPEPLYKLIAGQLKIDPLIDQAKCSQCLVCVRNCPAKTINYDMQNKSVTIDLNQCIHCFCCHELCKYKAIKLERSWLARMLKL